MALSRDSKAERLWKLYRRSEFRLKQGIERINWEEDVLIPEIEKLKANKALPLIPADAAFDMTVIDEVPNTTPAANAPESTDGGAIPAEASGPNAPAADS